MQREEIFENRREIGKKLCEQIRQNNFQMINAKNFSERSHYDGEKKYKFSTANYLRLLAAEKIYTDSRWYKICDVEKNNWTLKENATFEILEEWQENESGKAEGILTKFYNASEILEIEKVPQENKNLEEILEFLQERGILENDSKIISFQDAADAIKKYAEKFVEDELTKILAVQMFVSESKLKTKLKLFLPTYSEEILQEIEKTPDKIFESANKAQAILKNLRREKIIEIAEEIKIGEEFQGLKIIYHGSEKFLQTKEGFKYFSESILKIGAAYEFLFMLKSAIKKSEENFKTWLEFFYKGVHEKILVKSKEISETDLVADFLKNILEKNQIEFEAEIFRQEEIKYLENHSEIFA